MKKFHEKLAAFVLVAAISVCMFPVAVNAAEEPEDTIATEAAYAVKKDVEVSGSDDALYATAFAKKKPAISKNSAYLNNKVYLAWSKVAGAKKYEIQRAKIDPKSGKTGTWKAWTTTKKTSVTMKATGDYKYRVRAVKGSQVSKWSAAKRIFAANAKITHMSYIEANGYAMTRGRLELRVLVSNKTKSPMGFPKEGIRIPYQHTVYAVDKTTGKILNKWDACLDLSSTGYTAIAKEVAAGKSQSIYLYAFITGSEWEKYKNSQIVVSSIFYPNPNVETTDKAMAIAYTSKVSDSSIAVK